MKLLPIYLNWQITPNFNLWAEARFEFDSSTTSIGEFEHLSGINLGKDMCTMGIRYTF